MRRREFLSAVLGGAAVAGGAAVLGPAGDAMAAPPSHVRRLLDSEPAIIYSKGQQCLWVVDANFRVIKTHRVSGRRDKPPLGRHRVYSKALHTAALANPLVRWDYMVRFFRTANENNIGFHAIPVRCKPSGKDCEPVQSVAQLGSPLSGGCVRQKRSDAQFVFNWAKVGTLVVVIA